MKHLSGCLLLLLTAVLPSPAQHQERLLDLAGSWKFEAGDNMRWADPAFNDRSWETIRVPGNWEDQGYPGYDGYAWYRKHFQAPAGIEGKMLLIRVGRIDDVDEVYVNGRCLGFSGIFPPGFETAYSIDREYQVPSWLLRPGGDNVIAVRVYDEGMNGGITGGDLGLYEMIDPPYPDLSLDGMWKFRTGDAPEWAEPGFNDAAWDNLYVPGYWETQGYKGYNGPAWYRVRLAVPEALAGQRLLLLAGRIDDFDEAFLNGHRIGRTGVMPAGDRPVHAGGEYRELRAYTIPAGILQPGNGNILAVRVFDARLHGGLYRGPVGLITRERYNRWRSSAAGEDHDLVRDLLDFLLR